MIVSDLGKRIIQNKDLYLIEYMNDMIIVNNEQKGITIYDENLKTVYSLEIMPGLMIDACYKNMDTKELLLYCRENNKFIHIEILKKTYKIIKIPIIFQEIVYSMSYRWRKDKVYIGDYSEHFFCIDISCAVIESISVEDIQCIDKEFYLDYRFYQKAIKEDYQNDIIYANATKGILGYKDINHHYIVETFKPLTKYDLGKIHVIPDTPSWKQIHFIDVIADLLVLSSEECVYLFCKAECKKVPISQGMRFIHAIGSIRKSMYYLFILTSSKRMRSNSYDIICKLGISI